MKKIRLFDVLLATCLLTLFTPILLMAAVFIFVENPKASPIFSQYRVGYMRRPFLVYKLRTLWPTKSGIVGLEGAEGEVTKVGKFLRVTSIDELPQLLNVLKGDMSIVGPRPHPIRLSRKLQRNFKSYSFRYKVKPGLTGLAQIEGNRGILNARKKIRHRLSRDIYYAKHCGLRLYWYIIMKTLINPRVLIGS